MVKKWSRRDFLKTSALFSTGVLLAACAPAVQPQPQQPAAATEAPKATVPSAEKKKIVFSTYTWSNLEASVRAVLDSWVAATPNVEYEAQFVPQTIDYWAKVQTQVASGTPPDCGIGETARLVSYAKNGTLLDITNYIMSSKFPLDKEFPLAIAQYRYAQGDIDSGAEGGNYYGLPSDFQPYIFAYNKKMFDDANVSYPTNDWTWSDMLSAAQKITKADENKWGIQALQGGTLYRGNFILSAGGSFYTPDYTKSMLADPKTIDAFKWQWDLIHTHKVAPPPGSAGQQNPFMSGQVAMIVDGIWWLTDFKNIKDFDWDVAMFPKHPQTGKRTCSMESDGWWIYKGAKDPDTSWNLISYMGGTTGQRLYAKANDMVPSTFPEICQEWYAMKPPDHKSKILDNISQDSAKVVYTYFESGTVMNAFGPIIDKAFADGTDITAAMKEADKVMTEELTKAWALLKS